MTNQVLIRSLQFYERNTIYQFIIEITFSMRIKFYFFYIIQ